MTTQELFSKVQIAINDPAFVKIQRSEYTQYFKETLGQIALVSDLYLDSRSYTPATEGETIIEFDLLDREPLKVEHLSRNGQVCREYSDNAIRNALISKNNRGFLTNNTELGDRAYSIRLVPNNPNTLQICFSEALGLEETVDVTFSTTLTDNSLPQAFMDVSFIPIYAFDCLYHGVLSKVMQTLMIKNSREYNNSWQAAEGLYSRKMKDLISYVRKLKSKAGVSTIQPMLWLSDSGDTRYANGGSGIPDEYHTNIIDWP